MSQELLTVLEKKSKGAADLPPGLDAEAVRRMYRLMVTTRLLDDRAMKLQRQGRIGFYVPSIGQEACAVGSAMVLTEEDWLFPSYREPGAALTLGARMQDLVNQWYGNAEDITKGRQMPVHYSFRAQRFVSISSPIGTQIVQAAGCAMAMKIRGAKAFAMTYFGDGATSSNDFHTGMNFAGVFRAPCVFFCSNNQWAISCPLERQTASESIAVKAVAYGMPGVRVDGNDVLAVWQATREAAERARAGEGPTLIEALTFRIGPHSSSDDPTRYRPQEVVEEWKRRDPIDRLEKYMKETGLWEDDLGEPLREKIQQEIAEAVAHAESVPPPPTESMFEDVYAEMPRHLREQRDRLIQLERTAGQAERDEEAAFPL